MASDNYLEAQEEAFRESLQHQQPSPLLSAADQDVLLAHGEVAAMERVAASVHCNSHRDSPVKARLESGEGSHLLSPAELLERERTAAERHAQLVAEQKQARQLYMKHVKEVAATTHTIDEFNAEALRIDAADRLHSAEARRHEHLDEIAEKAHREVMHARAVAQSSHMAETIASEQLLHHTEEELQLAEDRRRQHLMDVALKGHDDVEHARSVALALKQQEELAMQAIKEETQFKQSVAAARHQAILDEVSNRAGEEVAHAHEIAGLNSLAKSVLGDLF